MILNENKTYIVLKTTIYLIGFVSLIFLSCFWIGTEENWKELIKNEFIPVFIIRTLFLIAAGLLFLGLSLGVNRLYKKEGKFSKEFNLLILFSVVVNLIRMLVL